MRAVLSTAFGYFVPRECLDSRSCDTASVGGVGVSSALSSTSSLRTGEQQTWDAGVGHGELDLESFSYAVRILADSIDEQISNLEIHSLFIKFSY